MLESLLSSVYLQSLSLTLLHFLWQGLLVALLLKASFVFIGDNKPKLRYFLAAVAMLVNFILPLVTFVIINQNGISSENPLTFASDTIRLTSPLSAQSNAFSFSEFLPYISLLWLTTIILLSSKLLVEIYNVNQLPKQANVTVEPALLARFNALASQLKLTKTPTLLISLKINVPMAIGWLKPVVLLPASMISGLTAAQLEMLLLHELAHIRRYDYLVNFMQTLVEILLFFHPAVMWVSKQMRNEREYCSDDIAVHHCGNAIAYAHTLADTATLLTQAKTNKKITIPSMAIAASGGDLKQRVVRLVNHHHCSTSNDFSKWLAALTIISAMLIFSSKQFLTHNLTYNMFDLWGYNTTWFKIFDPASVKKSATNQPKTLIEQGLITATLAQQLLFDNKQTAKPPKANTPVNNMQPTASSHLIAEILSPSQTKVNTAIPVDSLNVLKAKSSTVAFIKKPTKHAELLTPVSFSSSSIKLEKALAPINTSSNIYIQKNMVSRVDNLSHKASTISYSSTRNNVYAQQIKELAMDAIHTDKTFFTEPFNAAMHASPTLFVESLAVRNIVSNNLHKSSKINVTSNWLKAKQLATAEPKYPSSAKRKGIEIEAKVFFTIDKNGLIKDVQFEHKSKMAYFKNSIRTAVRKWRFLPAKLNGKPIESSMSKIFSFSLKD